MLLDYFGTPLISQPISFQFQVTLAQHFPQCSL